MITEKGEVVMSTEKVRMGIVGTGPRCRALMDCYLQHPALQVVACCDTADGAAEEMAAYIQQVSGQEAAWFISYEAMRQQAVYDALLIACDPDVQVDIACDAMQRGIHVMTEVPAAFSIEQCWQLVKTVEATGVTYQLAEQTRYWRFIRLWRQMAQRGDFGKILYAEGEYLHYEPLWDSFRNRKTGRRVQTADPVYYAQLADWELSWRGRLWRNPILYLPHTLSPLLSITGGRIAKVACFGTRPLSYATEGLTARDLQTAILYNTADTVFSVRAGFTAPYGEKRGTYAHWYQVKGTARTVEWARSTIDTPKQWTPADGWQAQDWTTEDEGAQEAFRTAMHGGADYYPIDAFLDAILHGKTPEMDVYTAVETAAPAILAAQSCEQGGVLLEVPDFRRPEPPR